MKRLVLFTTEEKSWISEKISEKISKHDASLLIFNPKKAEVIFGDTVQISDGKQTIELTENDIVLPRINEHDLFTKMGLLMASAAPRIINSKTGALYANDKFISQVLFTRNGIRTPKTYMVGAKFMEEFDSRVVEYFGEKWPVIVKTRQGTHGTGVMLVDSAKALKSLCQYLIKRGEGFLLQEYVPHDFSYRIITLGDGVLAANKRSVGKTEFRTNAHAGAETVAHEPSEKEVGLATQIAKLFGLEMAAVDYLVMDDGEVVVFEVNASPGLENIQTNFEDKDLVDDMLSYIFGEPEADVLAGDDEEARVNADAAEETVQLTQAEAELVIHRLNGWETVIARVDTGAGLSSIHGENVRVNEKDKKVTFTAFDKTYTVPLDRHVLIKNSNGKVRRPVVKFDVSINGKELKQVDFTISTRDDLAYTALIGRNILQLGGFSIVFEDVELPEAEELVD